MKKLPVLIGLGVFLFLTLLGWAVWVSNKPQLGQTFPDLGQEHITDIFEIKYNSNPPTSGKHFPMWAKKGIYPYELSDGYLLHSLEHGYIVISYNCTKSISNFQFPISKTFAHEEKINPEDDKTASSSGLPAGRQGTPLMHMKANKQGEMSPFTPKNPPAAETQLPDAFKSQECKQLVTDLSGFLTNWQRVVIVPRSNMDSRIALTAWTHLEKMNSFDNNKIEQFIKAYHNQGPEKTIE